MKKSLVFAFVILSVINNIFAQVPGTPDLSFAANGELADSIIFPFKYSGLALSPGGEFVISSANGDTIQAIRYTSTGARDINFGLNSTGYVQIVTSGFSGTVTTSAVQTDQKILIAGQYANTANNKKAYLLRLNADGTIDNTFGTNGWFFFNFLPKFGETVHQIALQADGKILALDMGNNPGYTDTFFIARIKTNGKYDSSFASNGVYQIPFNNFLATSPSYFQLDAANNVMFAAYSNYLASDYLYMFRLTPAGALDNSYGTIFIDSTNIINGGANLGLNFQTDGKLITVQSKQTGSILWAVCRYNTDGSIDQSFGENGLVNVQPNLGPVPYSVTNIAYTSKNTILIAGVVSIAGANRVIVNNFNPDGSPDLSFGNNAGSELLNCFEYDDRVYNLVQQPDGGILINGLVNEMNYKSYEVIRLYGANPTAIKTVNPGVDFSVYPNPANTQIHFELSKPANGTVSLTDITGKLIYTQQTGNNLLQTMDVSSLSAGVYLITYRDSETSVSKKIVKE